MLARLRKYLSPIELVENPQGAELYFQKKEINLLLGHLKAEFKFLVLIDITAVDLLGKVHTSEQQTHRYELIYQLLNLDEHFRLRIKVPVDSEDQVQSAKANYPCAPWFESEIWDLFGISFEGNPNQRILNHESFIGHPLMKDFVDENGAEIQTPVNYFNEKESVKVLERKVKSVVNIGPVHPIMKGGGAGHLMSLREKELSAIK